jgi:hypothetical protein
MDELMYANKKKTGVIMRFFPDMYHIEPNRVDFDHVSALYKEKKKQIARYDNTMSTHQRQLDLLTAHVAACYDVWDQARVDMISRKHSIVELYCLRMEGEELPGGSRSLSNDRSPVKRGSARPEKSAKAAKMRELAKIWHEGLCLEDVSWICVDTNEVKRLMVSCAAAKSKPINRPIFPYVPHLRSLSR